MKKAGGQERVYELEVLPGLEEFAIEELREMRGVRLPDQPVVDEGDVRFAFYGPPRAMRRLKSAVAAYLVEWFDVPRPKGLLGHEHLTRLVRFVQEVMREDEFTSFRLSAAGRESGVYQRLAQELERATQLRHDPEEGEMVLRFVPSGGGWEVMARLTNRPLSARAWRKCNMAGGLNATVGHVMARMGGLRSSDRVFNPMCGSGTLLIERAALGDARMIVGADIDDGALACARENVAASGHADIEIGKLDVVHGELPARAFDVILVDLPWGDAIGSHEANETMYPSFLRSMAHVGSSHARMVVLTHEVRLFERVLDEQKRWRVRDVRRVYHGGHWPRLYVLQR